MAEEQDDVQPGEVCADCHAELIGELCDVVSHGVVDVLRAAMRIMDLLDAFGEAVGSTPRP